MNPDYDLDDYKFPKIKTKPWKYIFINIDKSFLKLMKILRVY